MSNRIKFLEKLLNGVEVEWKALGEVVKLEKGRQLNKELLSENGIYPAYNGGISFSGYTDIYNYNENTIIISQGGASAGFVNFIPTKFYANAHCYVVLPNIIKVENRYIFHFLKLNQERLMNKQHGAGIPALRTNEILDIPIPIPPLSVQKEIVRMLDTFTALTAELTAELTARKKQYSFYREQLLSFKEGEVEWKTLGEVVIKSYSGSTPRAGDPKYYNNGTIPWLRTQEVKFTDITNTDIKISELAVEQTSAKWIPVNCVIIAISGATAGRSAINKIPLTTNQHCLCLEINSEKTLYRYVFHWVSFNYETLKSLGQGARGDLNSSIIKNYKIPVPPLAEQARIVAILDKFDTLTTSISEGLPKEIELRKKQYEYYREQLLMF
jgi:type I restriction enzyme S subunit